MRLSWAFVVASLVAITAAPAGAQPREPSVADRDNARQLMDDGDRAMDRGDAKEALRLYEAAHAIMKVPTTGLAVAQAQEKGALLIEARDTCFNVLRAAPGASEPDAFVQARAQCTQMVESLAKRIPSITLDVKGDAPKGSLDVTIDGAALPREAALVPRRVNPGKRTVVVRAEGYRETTTVVDVAEATQTTVPVALVRDTPVSTLPPPETAPPTDGGGRMSVWLPVGLAVTGVGLAVGIPTGIVALGEESAEDEWARPLPWIANAGFLVAIGGAVMTTVGVVLTASAEPSPPSAKVSLRPLVGPGWIGVDGAF